jgi:hypothetical protein
MQRRPVSGALVALKQTSGSKHQRACAGSHQELAAGFLAT